MAQIPVLVNEVVSLLRPSPGGFIIDGTANGGGHTRALLSGLKPNGRLLALDWDKTAIAELESSLKDKSVIFIHGNYLHLPRLLSELDLPPADGLLLDLGFSFNQIERSGRGFSFSKDEPLYMTYDEDEESVASILSRLSETELADIIWRGSGERYSRRIARAIKSRIKQSAITSSFELAEIIRHAVPPDYEHGRLNPATRTFQALRIYANRELENLSGVLEQLDKIVCRGGRVVIISFHSLEDRLVKEKFRELVRRGQARLLTKKPLVASLEEVDCNPKSRSAKLRALELL